MIKCLKEQPLFSITPDRGKEFAKHAETSAALNNVQFHSHTSHGNVEQMKILTV